MKALVAGPHVFICDECIDLCSDIIDEQLLRLIEGDEGCARAMSTERLSHYVEHASKGEQRNRLVLQRIERMLHFDATQRRWTMMSWHCLPSAI